MLARKLKFTQAFFAMDTISFTNLTITPMPIPTEASISTIVMMGFKRFVRSLPGITEKSNTSYQVIFLLAGGVYLDNFSIINSYHCIRSVS